MRGWIGLREIWGPNRAPWIDRWNRARHVPLGSSYCATCVSFALDSAGAIAPRRSALALGLTDETSFSAADILAGRLRLVPGDLVHWRAGDTWRGHVGVVERVIDRSTIITIEANTGPGPDGNQRDGDGVWRRRRTIVRWGYFSITKATHVRYREDNPTRTLAAHRYAARAGGAGVHAALLR